ncbi:unnamed protein product [Clonostachys rosea]|uniref:Fungal N-terminal domain-containing protein n=1 Tax=Bionectria ochroleuca TaxID=29856 RepID=A0ABY6U7U3_BIOOC|nr:unnamed protein product [Clonostachys rosea]
MAELVGLVSAIAALATLGFKLTCWMSNIAEELGTAGQLKSVAVDIKALVLVLHELKKHLKNLKYITKQAFQTAQDIIDQCAVELKDLEECIAPLLNKGDPVLSLSWMMRVKWFFAKSKLATRRTAIDSLELTLDLSIPVLVYWMANIPSKPLSINLRGEFSTNRKFREYMEAEMKVLVEKCANTKAVFLEAERYGRTIETLLLSSNAVEEALQLEDGGENDRCALSETTHNEVSTVTVWNYERARESSRSSNSEVIGTFSDDQTAYTDPKDYVELRSHGSEATFGSIREQ